MKFAVNYSDPLIQLLKEDVVKVDLLKCPDWIGMIEEAEPYGPITLHYDMDAGLGTTFSVDFSRIIRLKEQTYTPHINTHLVTPRTFDPTSLEERVKINKLWRDEINFIKEHVGATDVALEHFPYTESTPNIQFAADSKIFSQVILDTGCMLLLDLAHAQITSHTLGVDVRDYIQSLPLDRLVELHTTGIKPHGGVLTDHFGMGEDDWGILTWALDEIRAGRWRRPEIIAFEYGGVGESFVWRTDIEVLRSQVPKLYNLIRSESTNQIN